MVKLLPRTFQINGFSCIRGILILLIAGGFALGAESPPAKFNRVLGVGADAPVWKNLPGVDGKRHSLSDHARTDVLVVMFTDNHCPATRIYEARLKAFLKEFREQSVELVAINVTSSKKETIEAMRHHAEKRSWPFAYLRDSTQAIGKAYGAARTPQFFVLDRKRNVAYMGALDDHNDPGKAGKHYLRDAVRALLAGEQPAVGEALQRGCRIEYAD